MAPLGAGPGTRSGIAVTLKLEQHQCAGSFKARGAFANLLMRDVPPAGVVAASRDSNADDEHDPEGATIAFERSQVDALVRQAREHLADIDAALAKVAAGTYGLCEVGGEPIPDGRLEARPTARTCVEHAR